MVAGVGVLVHRRERVGAQRCARGAESRRIHGGMVVTGRPTAGLGSPLVEVVCRRVVVLAVSRRRCRRPDGVVSNPRMLLQFDKRRLVHPSHTSGGVRRRRAVRRCAGVLVRRWRQTSAAP
jgi:hypothetical protein